MVRSKLEECGIHSLWITSLGYTSSLIDDCVFFHSDIIFWVYVDDGIFLGNYDAQLLQAIEEIQGLARSQHQETSQWLL
jgi:hypothetical protein